MKEMFTHMVFFWMKEPDNKDHRKIFEASLRNFIDNSQHVVSQHIGIPAGTNRSVVDGSFTFSLVVTFNSSADHDAYQSDPAHHKFIAECQNLWERVQVYDSISL